MATTIPTTMATPAWSAADGKRFLALEAEFNKTSWPFTVAGSIPLEDLEGLGLYYSRPPVDNQTDISDITFVRFPLDDTAAAKLHDMGKPSPFGHGSELKFDEEYRSAHELKPPAFALTIDPVSTSSVLTDLCHRLPMRSQLSAKLHKLNTYSEGGFFKPHQDTPRGDNHLGTLTVCYPTNFTGGELVVRHQSRKKVWPLADLVKQPALTWVFLYSDLEHQALPVTSGTRLTVTYDVFTVQPGHEGDASTGTLTAAVNSALADHEFMTKGGALLFGLQHSYPFSSQTKPEDIQLLKGGDGNWFTALRRTGLETRIVGVYKSKHCDPNWSLNVNRMRKKLQQHPHRLPARARMQNRNIDFVATTKFDVFSGQRDLGWGLDVLANIIKDSRAYIDPIWVTKPVHFDMSNRYTTYGNEPQAAFIYVSLAIALEVPEWSKRNAAKVEDGDAEEKGETEEMEEKVGGEENLEKEVKADNEA